MKSFLLVACFTAAVAVVHSIPPWVAEIAQLNGLSDNDLVKHFRTNLKDCPDHISNKDDATLKKNLRKHLNKIAEKSLKHPNIAWGLSCMSALSEEEYNGQVLTLKPVENPNKGGASSDAAAPVPSRKKRQTTTQSVDWRSSGYVTPVKNQGQCGSCWTFSATGAMEGAIFKATGKLPNLSEQNLVDCIYPNSSAMQSDACNGGFPTDGYDYVIKNLGIDTGASYPYKAVRSTKCAYNKANTGGLVKSWAWTKQNNETDLELAVRTVGPVSAGIDATDIQNYKSGVFKCPTSNINHAILVVGYGVDSTTNQKYWLVKNSWGTSWGESGYIRIAKDASNACGIAYAAQYPKA